MPPPVPWRAAQLLAAPHRLCFFWAGCNAALAAAWWAAQLLANTAWPWAVPPATAHGLWFTLGAMPLFIAGFMFTAGPQWLKAPAVDTRPLRAPVAAFVGGWALAVPGFHASALLAGCGLLLVALGWAGLCARLLRLVHEGTRPDRRHARLVAAAAVALVLCLLAAALAVALADPHAQAVVVRLSLWSVVLVFGVVSHRMLPFLGDGAWDWADRRWPDWPLWAVASVPLLQALAAPAAATHDGWRWCQALHLAAVAALSLRLVLHWRGHPALKQPLMGMLFGALAWWTVALLLLATAAVPLLPADLSARAGLAGVHALTMGYLGGTLLAMSTRVSTVHSGRPQAVDGLARALHALLQAAVASRVAAALWPAAALLLDAAALAWAAVAMAWFLRHGRWAGQPRVDGKPG